MTEEVKDQLEEQIEDLDVDAFAEAFDEIADPEAGDDDFEEVGGEEDKGEGEAEGEGEGEADPQAAAEKSPAEQDAEYWRHKYQSDAGRVSAFQRQINELKAQLESKDADDTEVESGSVEAFEDLKKDFPEIANAVESYVSSQLGEVAGSVSARVKETISPLEEERRNRFYESQYEALEAAHPDYRDVVQTTAWDKWLDEQPKAIKDLAGSDHANEVSAALSYFKGHQGPSKEASDEVADVIARRKKQLDDAAGPTSKRVQTPRKVPKSDFDGAFDHYAKG